MLIAPHGGGHIARFHLVPVKHYVNAEEVRDYDIFAQIADIRARAPPQTSEVGSAKCFGFPRKMGR